MNQIIHPQPVDWKSELTKIATKQHVIVCWVAIILNPIWSIADYYTLPSYWNVFLVIRLMVSALTLFFLILSQKFRIRTELVMLVPVLGISLQNAYMWSVMDVPLLQKHTFAYIALFIGTAMLVLWRTYWTITVVVLSFIANVISFLYFSKLSLDEILINGGLLVFTVALFSIVLIQTRYSLTKKELISRLQLIESNKQLELQKTIIEEKNKEITESINYAQGIQKAKLPPLSEINKEIPANFILYKPKDIVSGDFYFFKKTKEYLYIAAVDCTGHGIPGAFMSMIASEKLEEIITQTAQPSEVLKQLNIKIKQTLKQTNEFGSSKDGMDIGLCAIDTERNTITFSGANRPLYVIKNKEQELLEIKATKKAIGGFTEDQQEYESTQITFNSGDTFYLSTDGYADTFNGKTNKKLKTKAFKELLLEIQQLPMNEQFEFLNSFIEDWKSETEQVDDILVIGFRL